MTVSVIAAVARRGVIGKDGKLPWYIPDDFKRFKRLTTGHVLIMGRKTYESIGRPLPGRDTIVVSRTKHFYERSDPTSTTTLTTAESLDEALALAEGISDDDGEIFICGGGEIYSEVLSRGLADKMYLTVIECDFEGDTYFPALNPAAWQEVSREEVFLAPNVARPDLRVPSGGLRYAFINYEKIPFEGD